MPDKKQCMLFNLSETECALYEAPSCLWGSHGANPTFVYTLGLFRTLFVFLPRPLSKYHTGLMAKTKNQHYHRWETDSTGDNLRHERTHFRISPSHLKSWVQKWQIKEMRTFTNHTKLEEKTWTWKINPRPKVGDHAPSTCMSAGMI